MDIAKPAILAARRLAVLAGALALAACTGGPPGIHDPHEAQNRAVFAENLAIDRAIFGPLSGATGGEDIADNPLLVAAQNVSDTLGQPQAAVNSILQARFDAAAENLLRFVINATVGIGGLFDPASEMGIDGRATDFGETLHVWGVREGAYLVVPLLGPTTERDLAGRVVDRFTNPLSGLLDDRETRALRGVNVAARLGDRARYADLLSLIENSADPYAQARLYYLQNRRFQLGMQDDAEYLDPYDDPYAQ